MDAVRSIQEVRSAAEKFREDPGGLKSGLPMVSWGLISVAGFAVMQVLFSRGIGSAWAYYAVGGGIAVTGALAQLVISLAVGRPRNSFLERVVGSIWMYQALAMGSVGFLAMLSKSGGLVLPACIMLMLAAGYGIMGVVIARKYYSALGLFGFGLAYAMAAWPAYWPLGFAAVQAAGLLLPGLWLSFGAKQCPKTSTT
jgi:hypothetical protein